jgi:hypothetical protein
MASRRPSDGSLRKPDTAAQGAGHNKNMRPLYWEIRPFPLQNGLLQWSNDLLH